MKKKPLHRSAFFNIRALIGVLLCCLGATLAFVAFSRSWAQEDPAAAKARLAAEPQYRGVLPIVHFDISPALRDMTPIPLGQVQLRENEDRDIAPHPKQPLGVVEPDRAVQAIIPKVPAIPSPTPSFNGPPNLCGGCAPPDPNGDVGPNHVVVMSNVSFQIFNKTGGSVFGPAANNTLWSGFGGGCQAQNAGDPVVLYDQLADRWILTQFTSASPFLECVAISTTGDPTGSYYRYAVSTGSNFPDYPKAGIAPNAYYFSTREFAGGSGGPFAGVGAYALNRAQALVGNPAAQVISFLVPPAGGGANVGDGLLPADMDGIVPPPLANPWYYIGSEDNNGPYGAAADALTVYKFVVNFANPPMSSFTLASTVNDPMPFNSILALCGGGRACIPQSGTANRIDHLGYRQRPLHRAAYRNFGSFESIITNQSVSAGNGPTTEVAGIRWWELRSPNAAPAIFQEGTYAPGLTDNIHRWMGSIAADNQNNMALAYSASYTTIFPSIRYTGRLVGDPAGQMPQGEASIVAGTGSQTGGGSRWGDYTSTTVDPVDDCTFWHVNEYVPTTSDAGWQLRIGAFKFTQCTPPQKGTAHFVVSICNPSGPLANANISIDGNVYGASAANGFYDAPLAPGMHTYSVTKPTFTTATGNFTITNGQTTNVNACLQGTPMIATAGSTLVAESCSPPNMAIDPGETVTVTFKLMNNGGAATTNLVATLQNSGGVTPITTSQNYGVINPGGMAGRDFMFTANGSCGGPITATLQLQDGANNLGTVTFTYTLGVLSITFSENFDGVTPPVLPAGWTVDQGTNASGFPNWVTSNSGTPTPVADSAPNAAYTVDPNNLLDNRIYTPSFMYTGAAQMSCRMNYDIEQADATTAYDAGVLEISINGGAYADIVTAGGSFVTGGYNHAGISTSFANPLLPSRPCWSGVSGGFVTTTVNLPASGAGQPVKLRWRMGSDNSVSHAGWRLDNVIVSGNYVCCVSAPAVTGAVSNKTHGGAGTFGINLPLTGTTGVECRSGTMTNDFTIKVTFASNVTVSGSPQAQVISGTGTIGSGGVSNGGMVTVMGSMVTIPLTNVVDQQTIQVRLNGVNSAFFSDEPAADVVIPMSRLLGDTNGNRAVNASDVTQTKGRIGQAVTSANFRSDVNANGSINSADASLVKANSGHGVP